MTPPTTLAAAAPADLLLEFGALLLAMGVLARIADRLTIPSIPVYLVTGLVLSSGPLRPEVSGDFVETGASIGVALLLFMLGLEYSGEELVSALRMNAASGVMDAVVNATPGALAALALGWGPLEALVLAGACWISSSGMVAKILEDLGRLGNRETPVVLSILVMEDLAMAVYLPVTAGLLLGGGGQILTRVGVALLVVCVVLVVALRWGERLSMLAFARSSEHMLLVVLGTVLLVAGVAERVSVSGAVGAFLVGMGLSGDAAERAEPLLSPMRDLFGAVYFLFFGLQVDVGEISGVLLPALALAAVSSGTKLTTGWWAAGRAGSSTAGRLRAGSVLMARGEFSLVIAGLALEAGLESDLAALVTTYVMVLAVLTPFATRAADGIGRRMIRSGGGR